MRPLMELRDELDIPNDRHLRDFRRMDGRVAGGAFSGAVSPLRRDLVAGPVPELGEHTDRIRAEFSK